MWFLRVFGFFFAPYISVVCSRRSFPVPPFLPRFEHAQYSFLVHLPGTQMVVVTSLPLGATKGTCVAKHCRVSVVSEVGSNRSERNTCE